MGTPLHFHDIRNLVEQRQNPAQHRDIRDFQRGGHAGDVLLLVGLGVDNEYASFRAPATGVSSCSKQFPDRGYTPDYFLVAAGLSFTWPDAPTLLIAAQRSRARAGSPCKKAACASR